MNNNTESGTTNNIEKKPYEKPALEAFGGLQGLTKTQNDFVSSQDTVPYIMLLDDPS
jgi:hypothetical protein